MAARITQTCSAVLLALLTSICTAHEQPPAAYQAAARQARIPAVVLFAVALQESGLRRNGRLIPWPWTLNVAGRAYRFPTRRQACVALRAAIENEPKTRIDVGLGQISLGYHGHRVKQPCDLLDPYGNLEISASILREHHREGDDWLIAVGRYHRPAGGTPAAHYRQGVEQHLERLTASSSGASSSRRSNPGGLVP